MYLNKGEIAQHEKKNLFIKSTLILICSGFLTKILGFIIKVIYTRIIGEYGISLYAIAAPTYSLLLTIATLAIPISISKLVSENKGRSIRILTSAAFLILSINFLLILLILLTRDFLATTLLKNRLHHQYYLLLHLLYLLYQFHQF